MKLLLILCPFFICTISKAQLNAGVNLGYSFGKSPVAGADIGYNLKEINFHGGFLAHMSNRVDRGIVSYVKAGHSFDLGSKMYATGSVGYAFLYKSADDKSLNRSTIIYSGEIGLKYDFRGDPMAVFLGATKAGEFVIASIGIKGFF